MTYFDKYLPDLIGLDLKNKLAEVEVSVAILI